MKKYECYEMLENEKYFDELKCLINFVGDYDSDDDKIFLNYIYVDEINVISSNGRVLTLFQNNDVFEAGFYRPFFEENENYDKIILKKEDVNLNYVNYKSITEIYANQEKPDYGVDLSYGTNFDQYNLVYQLSRFLERNDFFHMNSNYLKHIPQGAYEIYWNGDLKKPVLFKSDDFEIYIMFTRE